MLYKAFASLTTMAGEEVARVRRRLILTWTLVATAVVLLPSNPGAAQEQILPSECPIAVPEMIGVDCGELIVPEDYEDPDGRQIRLPYIILRSPSPTPEPDPVVFTAGGPGYSSLDSVWWLADSLLLDDRDVVVFEQRGNRYADPALVCDQSVWWEETTGHTPCLDRIQAAGIDITQYTTQNIVRDLVTLRQSLGYEQWNLYGTSFSTSVMLLAMDADPEGTRSAILQSVKPPNETTFAHEADSPLRAIEQVFTDCEADEECAAAYPNLADDFFTIVRRLNDEPLDVMVRGSAEQQEVPISFDGDHFIDWIAVQQLYGPIFGDHDAAYLPLMVDAVGRGENRPLEFAAQSFWNWGIENPNWALGLMFAINCQQDLPAAGPVRPVADLAASEQLDGFLRSTSQRAICEVWNLDPLAPAAVDPVRSDVPALVLAGSYDPVTPPVWSRTTAEHLPKSTYVEFPGYGHDVTTDNPCAADLEAMFVADPAGELDTSCVETAPGPSFVLPGDVYGTAGLAQSAGEVSLGAPGGVAWIEAIVAVGIYGSILLLPILVVSGLFWLVRTRHRTAETLDRTALAAYALAVLATLGALAVGFLLDDVTEAYANRSRLAFALGPSRDLLSARLLAWTAPLSGVVIMSLVAAVVWAWLADRWSWRFRLLATSTALCTFTIVLVGTRWGLYTMLV